MKTSETIDIVCGRLGITKAALAKKMGMLPSSLYKKLARETMSFEELQECLDVVGVKIEFDLEYPDGKTQNSRDNHEMLLKKQELMGLELEVGKRAAEFARHSLRDLRTELNNAVGYADLAIRQEAKAKEYLEKIQTVLDGMGVAISRALGESFEEDSTEAEPEKLAKLKGMRVLVAEDNELNREIIKAILSDQGLEADEAANGSEAIEIVGEKAPGYYHFILMDLEMPLMDGYETTMRIRSLPNRLRANTPVIALTANASLENRTRAKAAGMDDFLAKPVTSAHLLRSLSKFV